MNTGTKIFPVTDDLPVMKVTVYLKSGASLSFPGRYVKDHQSEGFLTGAPLEVPFVDFDAVALVIQEPWPEEN